MQEWALLVPKVGALAEIRVERSAVRGKGRGPHQTMGGAALGGDIPTLRRPVDRSCRKACTMQTGLRTGLSSLSLYSHIGDKGPLLVLQCQHSKILSSGFGE